METSPRKLTKMECACGEPHNLDASVHSIDVCYYDRECDECNGAGFYYIDGSPEPCVCTEIQEYYDV